MKKGHFIIIVLQFVLLCAYGQISDKLSNASVLLYNPTDATVATVIEIPTGSIASPGLIDWGNVHLVMSGMPVPFSIREGRAHWKSTLAGPIKNPRPEDLLVFSVEVPAASSCTLMIVKGPSKCCSHLTRRKGNIVVSYPGFSVSISESTGMLTSLLAFNDSLLPEPMSSRFFEVAEGVVDQHGSMNPGNTIPSLSLKKGKYLPSSSVELVSSFSTDALTELNFVLKYKSDISVSMTYRAYPSGQLEIISDERPWEHKSPWLKYGVENRLFVGGTANPLDAFQTYFPYYGFKDYASSVKSIGEYYKSKRSTIFVFGEESLNGRFYKRKLKVIPNDDAKNETGIIDLLSEGIVVLPQPVAHRLPVNVFVKYENDDSAIARTLATGLSVSGINANLSLGGQTGGIFTLELLGDAGNEPTIGRDGFRIDPAANGIKISATSKFGLYKAVVAFLKYFTSEKNEAAAPLIASNPVTDLRAGGFGGGPFEVDFPWGDEAEWRSAVDGMMMSGMSSMTDLGMWSNWKMPVSFKYMPDLKTADPDAYDEVSGARFSEFDSCRAFALNLIDYIHARGGKVWLWVPVGAIPVTFEKKFPDATVPGKSKVPRFMHPAYRHYLESYFKELLETYPLDGFVLIRDDNGGIDDTKEFKQYLEVTKTKDRVWEQYIVLHKLIRDLDFSGTIAVYPYFDLYKPAIEEFLPEDMLILGHGSGMGTLTRNYGTLGTMGDTWLDDLFVGFRIPSTEKLKRLLSDRGSYWIGGAYTAMELTWHAIGYFGWEPTASVNTFRHDFGSKTFGESGALDFMSFSEASDNLWEIMNGPLFPARWFSFSGETKDSLTKVAKHWLVKYKEHLSALEGKMKGNYMMRWIKQAGLYYTYFSYHLDRANISAQLEKLVMSYATSYANRSALPEPVRRQIISLNDKIYELAGEYDRQMAGAPGNMLAAARSANLTEPFREFVYGYSGYAKTVDQVLSVKQFDAIMTCTTTHLQPGEPFDIRVDLKNTGFMPWMKAHGFELKVRRNADRFSLKDIGGFVTQPFVFGDTISVGLQGVAPKDHGSEEITVALVSPFRDGRQTVAEQQVLLKW